MNIKQILGKRLHECRQEKNMTQKEVANAVGITQQQYAGYERGHHAPKQKVLIALSHLFDVSIDFLLGLKSY